MEIFQRIKYLRKDILHITQAEFATKIKVSRSNLTSIETARISVTDRVVNDICNTFSINEIWLRNGSGDMFADNKKNLIEKANELLNLDETESLFLSAYLQLKDDERKNLKQSLKKIIASIAAETKNTLNISIRPTDEDSNLTRKQKEALMKKEFDDEEKRQTSSASTSANGSLKKEA